MFDRAQVRSVFRTRQHPIASDDNTTDRFVLVLRPLLVSSVFLGNARRRVHCGCTHLGRFETQLIVVDLLALVAIGSDSFLVMG